MQSDAEWEDGSLPFGTEEEWSAFDKLYGFAELETLVANVPLGWPVSEPVNIPPGCARSSKLPKKAKAGK